LWPVGRLLHVVIVIGKRDKNLMYTFLSVSHVANGLAHACLAVSVRIPAPAVLIVVLDLMAVEAVRALWNNVIVMNLSCHLTFMKVCVLKQAILEDLLSCRPPVKQP
jgi:hypothetical protein